MPVAQQPQQHQGQRHHEEDIFSIVGGCELGGELRQHPLQQADNASTNSLASAAALPNSSSGGNLSRIADVGVEDQPSRILFVRGLDASVSDEALVQMFEVCNLLALTASNGPCISCCVLLRNICYIFNT